MERLRQKSRSYRDLDVWRHSIDFVKEVYRVTGKFPPSEIYGLTNQVRRAAVSIPSNIAEGQGRNSSKEFRQFMSIALGSVAEVETQLIIAKAINYLTDGELNPLLDSLDIVKKMLKSLSKSIK